MGILNLTDAIIPKKISVTTRIIPGIIPPKNKCMILVIVVAPTKMIGRLGGKSSPMLPEEVSSPMENFSGYFICSDRTEKSMPPRARIVTPEAPVKDVKNAQIITVAIIIPPGIQLKRLRKVPTSLSPALLSERKKPTKVKRGMGIILSWVSAI
jgi:hypothetical protein